MAYYVGCEYEPPVLIGNASIIYDAATNGDQMYKSTAWGNAINYYNGVVVSNMTKNNPYMYILQNGVWKEVVGSFPDAVEIPFEPQGVITSDNVQGAIEELEDIHSHSAANQYAYSWLLR